MPGLSRRPHPPQPCQRDGGKPAGASAYSPKKAGLGDRRATQNGNNVVEMDTGSIREGQTKTGRVKLKAARPGGFRGKAVASGAGGLQVESAETTTVITRPKLRVNIEGPESEYVDRVPLLAFAGEGDVH